MSGVESATISSVSKAIKLEKNKTKISTLSSGLKSGDNTPGPINLKENKQTTKPDLANKSKLSSK